MRQKTYLTILKVGVYLSFLSVFLVWSDLLFPYITSKQIYFNILIEVLFVFWLAFIVKFSDFGPKRSWISIGLISYFIAILVSCFFSVDFNLSFWGDIERMLGFFHILHFLAFYFIVITVMRKWEDWRNLLIVSVAAAFLVSLYSFKINYSTIGNAAYVGGYLIFNIYFALLLFFRTNNWLAHSAYIVAMFFMLVSLKNTDVAGAYVGLGASVFLALFLYGSLNKNKKAKAVSWVALAVLVVLVSAVFANRDSAFVRNNKFLRLVTREISLSKNTFQTRLISWRAAWRDFGAHPVLGTGYGNYAITFDKYFDPKFYNYTRSETYFDRAHNNLIDIASTTGIVGLLAYLSIFAAVGYYLARGYRKNKIPLINFVLLTSLIAAYFIQNLAVFDSLVTYISLMVALGFVYWLADGREEATSHLRGGGFVNKEIYALFGIGLAMLLVIYQYNIKPLKMLVGTIEGQTAFARGDTIGGYEAYKKALSYDTPLDRDSRDSLIRFIAQGNLLKRVNKEKAREILNYTIKMSERNLEYNPRDSLMLLLNAQLLNTASVFYKDSREEFYYYSNQALEAVDKSIESSPGRIPIYFQKAQIYVTRGEVEKAIEILEYAVSLNEDYYESVCQLAKIQIAEDKEDGYSNMGVCIDKGGARLLSPAGFVKRLVNYYVKEKDWPRVLKLYERLSRLDSRNAKVWANLANLYARLGNKEKAKEAAERAAELDPAFTKAAEEFIRSLGEE
jgi:O-antigen ligase